MRQKFPELMGCCGVICLIVAVVFGTQQIHGSSQNQSTFAHAGAACGFAISGGLCFIAAAIALRGDSRKDD